MGRDQLMASKNSSGIDFDIKLLAIGDPMDVLPLFNQSISSADQRASKYAAKEVVERAKGYASAFSPGKKNTDGHIPLIDTIETFFDPGKRKWGVRVGAPHAVFVEFGTRKMGAKPFLRPAISDTGFGDLFADAIWSEPKLKAAMMTPVIRDLDQTSRLTPAVGKGGATGLFTEETTSRISYSGRWTPWGRGK